MNMELKKLTLKELHAMKGKSILLITADACIEDCLSAEMVYFSGLTQGAEDWVYVFVSQAGDETGYAEKDYGITWSVSACRLSPVPGNSVIQGYGVELNFKEWKEDLHGLLDKLPREIRDDYFYYLGKNQTPDNTENLKAYINGYVDESLDKGLGAVLKRCIWEHEDIFLYGNGRYLYVSSSFPWDAEDANRNLYKFDLEQILRKWVGLVTDEEPEFKYLLFDEQEADA